MNAVLTPDRHQQRAFLTDQAAEEAISFECEGEQLFGVLHRPEHRAAQRGTAVIVVVGGPQYRVGSHRQFVLLARHVASAGFPTLRFDCRGMGDASGEQRNFESLTPDIHAAILALRAHEPSIKSIVLWGLCDGASAALLYIDEMGGAAVDGLCVVNPWVRSQETHARAQVKHYYKDRLLQKSFWLKLLRGGVSVSAVSELASSIRKAFGKTGNARTANRGAESGVPFQTRMSRAWDRFQGSMFLALSSDDHTAKEFLELANGDQRWKANVQKPHVWRSDFKGADHTFSSGESRRALEAATVEWLGQRERNRLKGLRK